MRYTPEDFTSETPPERIIGTEMEYTLQYGRNSTLNDDLHYVINRIERLTGDWHPEYDSLDRQYFLNGSRVYIELHKFLEYATPECLGPKEATAADFAGIALINQALGEMGPAGPKIYRRSGYRQLKPDRLNSKPGRPHTTGFHENFMTVWSRVAAGSDLLATHLSTETIWAGNGLIDSIKRRRLGQKVQAILPMNPRLHRSAKTAEGSKPLFLAHTDEHDSANPGRDFVRLETRCRDANMSPLIRYIGLASTSLVLRLIEHPDKFSPKILNRITMANPYREAKRVGEDVTLRRSYRTRLDEKMRAIDFQEALAEAALKLSSDVQLPEDELDALDKWVDLNDRVRRAAEQKDPESLADQTDWAGKFYVLDKKVSEGKIKTEAEQVAFDIDWEKLGDKGIGQLWWAGRQAEFIKELQPAIDELKFRPPQSTRANARVHAQISSGGQVIADWAHVNSKRFLDPYESRRESY